MSRQIADGDRLPVESAVPDIGAEEAAVFEAPATAVAAVELLAARTMPKLV